MKKLEEIKNNLESLIDEYVYDYHFNNFRFSLSEYLGISKEEYEEILEYYKDIVSKRYKGEIDYIGTCYKFCYDSYYDYSKKI